MAANSLTLVRHGESTANIAATAAEIAGAEVVDAPLRDADVPLSEIGAEQGAAVGRWLAELPADEAPELVWCSPYLRAAQTAQLAVDALPSAIPMVMDERLRDRELGILDTLTTVGVEARHPGEAARRRRLGKFYYRPPGGESWADVALRLRAVLDDIDRRAAGRRVLIVSHDAVITLIRYICEALSEQEVLESARSAPLLNASVTRLLRSPEGDWRLDIFNSVKHLEAADAAVTAHTGDRDSFPHGPSAGRGAGAAGDTEAAGGATHD